MRVVVADDVMLVRSGLARILEGDVFGKVVVTVS